MSKSCVGCKFLFGGGDGYSDWTWIDTYVMCALGRNSILKEGEYSEPSNWNQDAQKDNWEATRNGRCDRYSPGPYVVISPDGVPDEGPTDAEQKRAIESMWHVNWGNVHD